MLAKTAMTGGYGSQLDPLTLDSDEHSSEGDTDALTRKEPTLRSNLITSADTGSTSFKRSKAEPVEYSVRACGFKRPRQKPSVTSSGTETLTFIPLPKLPKVEDAIEDEDCFIVPSPSKPQIHSLTPEQRLVIDFVKKGENVFYSGSGGTGKSLVLHHIVDILKDRFRGGHNAGLAQGSSCGCFACNVAITAPTGIAAIPIGGTTLHRATGIGIPRRRQDFNRMWSTPVKRRWRNLSVWIIDEISMVSAELLEYLEQMIRRIRTPENCLPGHPFGGLQVIFSGDFFQLQPVLEKITHTSDDQFLNRGLAFEAPAWARAKLTSVILQHVFRQNDGNFVDLLNGIRTGEKPAALEEIAKRCSRSLPMEAGILPTVLYSKNVDVDKYNHDRLRELPEPEVVLVAEEKIITSEGLKEEKNRNLALQQSQFNQLRDAEFWKLCTALKEISLKVGAQVMLVRNLTLEGKESDLVNGSRGVVVGWAFRDVVLEECLAVLRSKQYPETPKEVEAQLMYDKLMATSFDPIPIVRFRNGREIYCVPEKFSYEILNTGECVRWQVPLKLAWAITIHKCQGMSLDYVQVTLKDIFAEGQVYVALSRARSMEGLQVIGNPSWRDVRVSPKVIEFYRALTASEAFSVSPLDLPDVPIVVPPEEILDSAKASHMVRTDSSFEKFTAKSDPSHPVICYHCKKQGHPAFECKRKPNL